MSYILIILAVLALLNTYPLLISQSLVFQTKETAMKSSVKMVESALSGLPELTEENVGQALASVEETGVSRLLVTDTAGRVLFDSREGGNARGMYAAYTEIVQALDGNDAFYCRYDSHAFLSRGASPVVYRNRIIGAVYAYEYDTQQAELLQSFQTNLTRISLFIGILVVALSTLLSRAFTRKIRDLLVRSVQARLDADAPLGFLLSGGLDSSLVCAISAKLLGKPIRTFAIGMDTDPIDLKYAQQAAAYLGADHTAFTMTRQEVLEALPEVVALLGTWDITTIRASLGMYLCCKKIREATDLRVLMTGEISDELFGYKYTDFAPSDEAFQGEAKKRVDEIHTYDVLRADRCIAANSMEGRVPFGDSDLVRYVMSIHPKWKRNRHGVGKYLLRKAFQGEGLLPDGILWRETAAFSDAVGHSRVDDLKAYAEAHYTDEEFQRRRLWYPHGTPFTKESLLYREIFEQHYPGQGGMIPAFWMPNPSWAGCAVDDPSARVLSNYGASGQ